MTPSTPMRVTRAAGKRRIPCADRHKTGNRLASRGRPRPGQPPGGEQPAHAPRCRPDRHREAKLFPRRLPQREGAVDRREEDVLHHRCLQRKRAAPASRTASHGDDQGDDQPDPRPAHDGDAVGGGRAHLRIGHERGTDHGCDDERHSGEVRAVEGVEDVEVGDAPATAGGGELAESATLP